MIENINVKKLNDLAKLPTRGSEYAAGLDLYANISEPIIIKPHTTCKIGTGISMELPNGTFGAIFARSGLATKKGLRPANCTGIIDSDYRGEYIVAIYNDSNLSQTIEPQERIAQLILLPFIPMSLVEVDTLTETARGDGGFGHSGNK